MVPKGISRMASIFLLTFSMTARTRILPPRSPSLYFEKSATPPVKKSGRILMVFPRIASMDASISSQKLCGRILQASPTAIPSTPCASNKGNLTGSVTGSLLRPSYDDCHMLVLGLKTTSWANLLSRASMYRAAAELSPVYTLPQFPWVSMSRSFCPICTNASPILTSPCGWYFIVWPMTFATLL